MGMLGNRSLRQKAVGRRNQNQTRACSHCKCRQWHAFGQAKAIDRKLLLSTRVSAMGHDSRENTVSEQQSDWWPLELMSGVFWDRAGQALPTVPWQPTDLVKVMAFSLGAAGAFTACNTYLLNPSPDSGPIACLKAAAAAASSVTAHGGAAASAAAQASAGCGLPLPLLLQQYAQLHFTQEALLSMLLPGAVLTALADTSRKPAAAVLRGSPDGGGGGALPPITKAAEQQQPTQLRQQQPPAPLGELEPLDPAAGQQQQQQQQVLELGQPAAAAAAQVPWLLPVNIRWGSGEWLAQTLLVCCLVFPVADPLLHELWEPLATAALGPPPANPLASALHLSYTTREYGSLWLHVVASGLLGPFWEEVFWRGFFLTALTKVLPMPLCVAVSSANFAALHLSPHNFLPLLVLGAAADLVYLRSGANLLAPYVLHAVWNSGQVLAIALLGKEPFV